jgi:hypothetical protein
MNQTPLDQLLKDLRFTSVYNKEDGGWYLLSIKQISKLTGLSKHKINKLLDNKQD